MAFIKPFHILAVSGIQFFTHIEMFGVFQFLFSLIEVIGKFKLYTVISRYDLNVK